MKMFWKIDSNEINYEWSDCNNSQLAMLFIVCMLFGWSKGFEWKHKIPSPSPLPLAQLLSLFYWLIDFGVFSHSFGRSTKAFGIANFPFRHCNQIKWQKSLTQIAVCCCYITGATPFRAGNDSAEYGKWIIFEHSTGIIIGRFCISALISLLILLLYNITLMH